MNTNLAYKETARKNSSGFSRTPPNKESKRMFATRFYHRRDKEVQELEEQLKT